MAMNDFEERLLQNMEKLKQTASFRSLPETAPLEGGMAMFHA